MPRTVKSQTISYYYPDRASQGSLGACWALVGLGMETELMMSICRGVLVPAKLKRRDFVLRKGNSLDVREEAVQQHLMTDMCRAWHREPVNPQ